VSFLTVLPLAFVMIPGRRGLMGDVKVMGDSWAPPPPG